MNNDNVDDIQKLTFENGNKINGVGHNLIQWLKVKLKHDEFIPIVEQMQKQFSELEIEFKLWLLNKISKYCNWQNNIFNGKTKLKVLIYNTFTKRYYYI